MPSTDNAGLLIDPFSTPSTITRYDAGEVLAALEGALVNNQTGMGGPFSSFHNTRVGQARLLDEQEIRALYRSNWWIRRVIETPAFDMTRKGVELKLLGEADTDLVTKVKTQYNDTSPEDSPFESEYSIDEAKAEAVRLARQFGRAYIVVRCNKGEDPSKPLKRVRSFEGVTVLDCYQLQPALEELNYYNPTHYRVVTTRDSNNKDAGNAFQWGSRIHRSRVLPYDGNRIHPYDVQVNGTGGHDSVVQVMFEIFTRYYQSGESVAEALQSFSLFVANINNLSGLISTKGVDGLKKYLQELNTQRSVYRTVVQDGQSSSGDFVERSFTGVAENIKHFAEELTAASDLPHYKIWGSESNTNALSGGGAESRAYAEKVAGWQGVQLHPNDRRLFKMLLAVETGGSIPDFELVYPSIYQPTPQEEEEIRSKQADRYATLSREGIILPLQARLALATEQDIANVLDADEIKEELEQSKALAEKQLDLEEVELEQSVQAATTEPEAFPIAPEEEPPPRTVGGETVPDLDEVASLLDDAEIRIDRRRGGKKGKKRNCRKGISCGNSCIARNKTCRKKPTSGQQTKAAQIRDSVVPFERPGGSEEGAAATSSPLSREREKADELATERNALVRATSEDEVKAAEANVQRIIDESDQFVMVPDSAIESIIDDGRLKSSVERFDEDSKRRSAEKKPAEPDPIFGNLLDDFDDDFDVAQDYNTRRTDQENLMFSGANSLSPNERPIYGYVGERNDPNAITHARAGQYGNISLRLKPEVKTRSTAVLDDSFNGGLPSSLSNINAASLNSQTGIAGRSSRLFEAERARTDLTNAKNASSISDLLGRGTSYLEFQAHGQVNTSDIAEMTFYKGSRPSAKVEQWARDNGVEITIID